MGDFGLMMDDHGWSWIIMDDDGWWLMMMDDYGILTHDYGLIMSHSIQHFLVVNA